MEVIYFLGYDYDGIIYKGKRNNSSGSYHVSYRVNHDDERTNRKIMIK